MHKEGWSDTGLEDLAFCFFHSFCLLLGAGGVSCFPFYHTMLLKLFASLSNALVALPCRKSMRTTVFSFHTADTYTKCLFCIRHCAGWGLWGRWNEWHPLRAHASVSAWLHLPGLFFCCRKTRVSLHCSSCCFSSSMGMDSSMRSVISDSISFDLASVHQLLIFCQATLNRSGF